MLGDARGAYHVIDEDLLFSVLGNSLDFPNGLESAVALGWK